MINKRAFQILTLILILCGPLLGATNYPTVGSVERLDPSGSTGTQKCEDRNSCGRICVGPRGGLGCEG